MSYNIDKIDRDNMNHAIDIIRDYPGQFSVSIFPNMKYLSSYLRDDMVSFVLENRMDLKFLSTEEKVVGLSQDLDLYDKISGQCFSMIKSDGSRDYTIVSQSPFLSPSHFEEGSFGYREVKGLPLTQYQFTNAHELGHIVYNGQIQDRKGEIPISDSRNTFRSECFSDSYAIASLMARTGAPAKEMFDSVLAFRTASAFSSNNFDSLHATYEVLGDACRFGQECYKNKITSPKAIAFGVEKLIDKNLEKNFQNALNLEGKSFHDVLDSPTQISKMMKHSLETSQPWSEANKTAFHENLWRDNPQYRDIFACNALCQGLKTLSAYYRGDNPEIAIHPQAIAHYNFSKIKNGPDLLRVMAETPRKGTAEVSEGWKSLAKTFDPENPNFKRIIKDLNFIADKMKECDRSVYIDNCVDRNLKIDLPAKFDSVLMVYPEDYEKRNKANAVLEYTLSESFKRGNKSMTLYVIDVDNPQGDSGSYSELLKKAQTPGVKVKPIKSKDELPKTQSCLVLESKKSPHLVKAVQDLQR